MMCIATNGIRGAIKYFLTNIFLSFCHTHSYKSSIFNLNHFSELEHVMSQTKPLLFQYF